MSKLALKIIPTPVFRLSPEVSGDVQATGLALNHAGPGHGEQRSIRPDFDLADLEVRFSHIQLQAPGTQNYPIALIILVLIPAGFAPSGTIHLTACGMTSISTGRAGPGSPSISVLIEAVFELTAMFLP